MVNVDVFSWLGNGPLNEGLCSTCRSMFTRNGFHQLWSTEGYQHSNLSQVRKHAQNGTCRFCEFFIQAVKQKDKESHNFTGSVPNLRDALEKKRFPVIKGFGKQREEKRVMFKVKHETFGPLHFPLCLSHLNLSLVSGSPDAPTRTWVDEFTLCTSEDDPCSVRVPRRLETLGFRSPTVIAAAKAILSQCRERHKKCALTEVTRLPTRVIDVNPSLSDPSQVKLHIPSPGEEHIEYVTLSYSWGVSPQPVQATQSNLSSLMQGFHMGELPQTIQDAIHVTRDLGFRYLWVDALCIIQDSDDDKGREIEKMGHIYRHSTLTLAASYAKTVYDGFEPAETKPVQESPSIMVELPMSKGPKGTLSIVWKPPRINYHGLHLNSRGWAFQESILSRRILLFMPNPVWVCGEDCAPIVHCKTSSMSLVDDIPRNLAHISNREGWFSELTSFPVKEWFNHVEDYSRRSLTNKDDKKRAITGCINVMQEIWGGECLFGLWKDAWFTHASWSCIRQHKSPGLKRSTRAPSWSWMSLDQRVYFTGEVATTNKQRLVSIVGPKLRLISPMIPAAAEGWSRVDMDLHDDDVANDTGNKPTKFLYLGVTVGILQSAVGLVVVQDENGAFRRVGHVTMDVEQWQDVPSQEITLV